MQKVQKESLDRLIFFDNIRYLMVLLVVVLHSAGAYSNHTSWWTVNDTNSIFFDYLLGVLDVFLMPTHFFIAGFSPYRPCNKRASGDLSKANLDAWQFPGYWALYY